MKTGWRISRSTKTSNSDHERGAWAWEVVVTRGYLVMPNDSSPSYSSRATTFLRSFYFFFPLYWRWNDVGEGTRRALQSLPCLFITSSSSRFLFKLLSSLNACIAKLRNKYFKDDEEILEEIDVADEIEKERVRPYRNRLEKKRERERGVKVMLEGQSPLDIRL